MTNNLSALLAAQVADSTRSSGDGETTNTGLISDLEDIVTACVERHDGRRMRNSGDIHFLAEFPGVVMALHCAVEIQCHIADRRGDSARTDLPLLSIGVNREYFPSDSEAWAFDKENSVAKLVEIAEPGGITISRPVYDEVRFQVKLPYDAERDPKFTAYQCQEYRQKLPEMNLMEASVVRIGAAALANQTGKFASPDAASEEEPDLIQKIRGIFEKLARSAEARTEQ